MRSSREVTTALSQNVQDVSFRDVVHQVVQVHRYARHGKHTSNRGCGSTALRRQHNLKERSWSLALLLQM
ncbi:hypothetical protein WJX74_003716 [Apatococcus lobatus]|uniref:Uncharacterized protein n=1 Tax=Apatococcus lobatus TaxID=904363 RepID=A0AAW1RJC0_9CHLO